MVMPDGESALIVAGASETGMKTSRWIVALFGGAMFGLIALSAASAQTADPQQPVAPQQPVVPPAAAEPAPAAAVPAAAQPAAAEPAAAAAAPAAEPAPAPAPKKAKPKKKKVAATTVAVTIRNSRTAKLVELKAGLAGADTMKKIAGPLAPGKDVAARVPRGKKDCLIDLSGTFDDGQTMDAASVDACAQKVLNLTE